MSHREPRRVSSFHTEKFLSAHNFSLIIPCYCEEPFLRQNVLRLVDFLSLMRVEFELVFVEDKSPDGTLKVLERLSYELEALRVSHVVLAHEKNQGRGAAVKTGIRNSKGDIAGFIDIDLENMPDAILPMYNLISERGADLVVGNRIKFGREARPLRLLTHTVYKWLVRRLVTLPISDTETGLKLFRRRPILGLLPLTKNDHWFWDTEVVLAAHAAGLTVKEHPVFFSRNPVKVSTVKIFRDSLAYLKALASYRRHHPTRENYERAAHMSTAFLDGVNTKGE